jgi:uncharacterized membrane protein YraQ (UPF0718 family)
VKGSFMFYAISIGLIIILMFIDSERTLRGIKKGIKKITKIAPVFINMIILVSISLYFFSDELILRYLGDTNIFQSILLALGIGSITFMPGFVVFPLAGLLLEKGVSYVVLAAFTTSMMMVGVLTFQIEREYYGTKLTIIRNLMGLLMAIIVSGVIGIVLGGLF